MNKLNTVSYQLMTSVRANLPVQVRSQEESDNDGRDNKEKFENMNLIMAALHHSKVLEQARLIKQNLTQCEIVSHDEKLMKGLPG